MNLHDQHRLTFNKVRILRCGGGFRIRIRVDGMLHEIVSAPKTVTLALTSRAKVMSNMDIGERPLPQEARLDLKVGESDIDVRVSTLPTLYGENVEMRIPDRTAVAIVLNKLGFTPDGLNRIYRIIHRPNGIFLVTGPTGSGNTPSLVRGPGGPEQDRCQDHHHRGPGRASDRRSGSDAGARGHRTLVLGVPALDSAPGPRRCNGR